MKKALIFGGIFIILAIVAVFAYKTRQKRKEGEADEMPSEEESGATANFIGVPKKQGCNCTPGTCHCFPLKEGSKGENINRTI